MYIGPGIYLNSFVDSITQMEYARNAGADGFSTYSYISTNNTGQTWSDWYPYVAANLFTAPAPIPDMPWRDPSTATEGTLWGQVTDNETGLPIDDATVDVSGAGAVQTDGNGYYTVTMIPASAGGTTHTVTASHGSYPDRVRDVDVFAGDIVRLDLSLGLIPGDFDGDGDVDLADYDLFWLCSNQSGPSVPLSPTHDCLDGSADNGYHTDLDEDLDIDLADFALFQALLASS